MDQNSEAGEVYVIQGENGEENEELSEVIVDDERPPQDDESTVWTEADGDNDSDIDNDTDIDDEINDLQEVPDDSVAYFTFHNESVYSVCNHKSKRGVVISGGGDDKGYLWKYTSVSENETESGKGIVTYQELGGHTDTVTSVGFSHDGEIAYTAGYDGLVRLWAVDTGDFIVSLDGPQDVEWAQWHGKGRAIIAGSSDGTVWMWVEIGGIWQCLQVYAGAHDGAVSCGCFSTDGKYVCTGGSDGTIRIWNPKTGKCKHSFTGHFGHTGAVTSMCSSMDGDLLLTGSEDGSMKLLQISGKRVLQTFVHFDPTATTTNTTTTTTTTTNPSDILYPPKPPPTTTTTSNNNKKKRNENTDEMSIENEGGQDEEGEGDVEEEIKILSVECVGMATLSATAATIGSEYQWVASGGLDSQLKIWDAVSGTLRHSCRHMGGVVALQWHANLPLLATAALDNLVRLWDARSGINLKVFSGHTDLVTNLELSLIPPSSSSTSSLPLSESSLSTSNSSGSTMVDNNEEGDTDMVSSVSDDGTVRIFHFHAKKLLFS